MCGSFRHRNCSYLKNVSWAGVFYLNCSTINHERNLNASEVNASSITNVSCINLGLNQNPTCIGNFLICNNINDPGFRIRRYYGGTSTANTTTIQNSDAGPFYFTQTIGINTAPTANIDIAINGNNRSSYIMGSFYK